MSLQSKNNKVVTLKAFVRDLIENGKRHFPGPFSGIEKYGLTDTQVYPEGTNFAVALEKATVMSFNSLVIDENTPVASIGTCFAEEFSGFMKQAGGNYLLVEENIFNSSANWGRVYTVENLSQIVEYSLDPDYPIVIENVKNKFIDPLREKSVGSHDSEKDAFESIKLHRKLSHNVFEKAKVLVITLGQNEAWEDLDSNFTWGSIPPTELLQKHPQRFRPRVFTYQESLLTLNNLIQKLRELNADLELILTVSPVASYATFSDANVITKSMEGKAVLRAVAGEICNTLENVHYFPSFEMVMAYNPKNFNADNRHVKRKTVSNIFNLLEKSIR